MLAKDLLDQLTKGFDVELLFKYFSTVCSKFRPDRQDLSEFIPEDQTLFKEGSKIGEVEYDDANRLIFVTCKLDKDLTGKESKKTQYEISRKILKQKYYDAGIFVFYGANKSFRLSLIAASYLGPKREFTTFRRYTYFVSPELTNKTFKEQLGKCKFSSIENILQAFSIEAVSKEFYSSFKPKFDQISSSIKDGQIDNQTREDFALLFAIRIIFLGFVEKKGWLGNDKFIQSFWAEYNQHKRKSNCSDEFYSRWLEPLFFESLNSQPGTPVRINDNEFSKETAKILQMAPYLNGELFKRKEHVDDKELYLPDEIIGEFFDFLFQYNFTIDENTAYDEELELNPEFLGIIFEKFVNKDHGAVYTPRTEVDLMCRLSLLRWLERKNEFDAKELYHLFFREGGKGTEFEEDQKDGNFSAKEIRKLLDYLENVTICDPAAGSGAFEVGMLHVINDTIEKLYRMPHFPDEVERKADFERKKAIIARSLYGVEVQAYAVWINQLRLWLTLFIDMPDEMKLSLKPLLPSLNFKIRRGDSLVQRIGSKMFPVHGDADIAPAVKKKITELKKEKTDFYYNQGKNEGYIRQLENNIFREIIQSQINEIRERIRRINQQDKSKGASGPQTAFLDESQDSPKTSASQEALKHELEVKSFELSQELKNLKDEHPLIWSIEFSEIFYDKGGFDIIIGNPPYVDKEDIADPEGKVEPKEYKELLCQMVILDHPYHFQSRKIDGRSDLYTFFYARSLHLLNEYGVHCFICSNSWLDVGYGVWMQEFLLENIPVNLIIDNNARRSFSSADINTIISLFDSPNKNYDKHNQLVKFAAFKKPFEECIFTENLWQLHEAKEITKNETFRVYPITAEKLYDAGWEADEESKSKEAGEYLGDKWGGKYLRAPDFFIHLLRNNVNLKKISDKDSLVSVEGYVHDNNTGESYPKTRFIKTIKETRKITLDESNTYLYGVKNHGNSRNIADVLFARTFGQDHLALYNCCDAIGKEFYKLTANKISKKNLGLYMNSTFLVLQRELYGLTNLGGGAIKFSADDVKKFVYPTTLSPNISFAKENEFLNREIKSIFEECGLDPNSKTTIEEQEPKPLPDRKELDDIVFEAIGLSEEERKDVYRAVCRLVWNRISKAKSV